MEMVHSIDCQEIGPYAAYVCTHCCEQAAKLLYIGLAGRVVDGGGTFRKHGCHQNVCGAGDRSLVQKHIGTFEMLAFGFAAIEVEGPEMLVIGKFSPQINHTLDVGVHPAPSYFVASRLREKGVAETGQKRPHHHHGSPQTGTFAYKFLAVYIVFIQIGSLEDEGSLFKPLHLHSYVLKQKYEVLYIQDFRNIGDFNFLVGQEYGTDYFQGLILRSLGLYAAAQPVSSFYYK